MSGRSRKKSPTRSAGNAGDPGRAFDPAVWEQARELAAQYSFRVEHHADEPWFYAFGIETRGAMGGGQTIESCHRDIREAMTVWVATMLERGEQPPRPASEETRSAQVNVRLTEHEKLRIEEAARQAGFRGVSDFVRAAALEKAG